MNDEKLEELRYYFTGYGSQHDETILKLIAQNQRYREAIEETLQAMGMVDRQKYGKKLERALVGILNGNLEDKNGTIRK